MVNMIHIKFGCNLLKTIGEVSAIQKLYTLKQRANNSKMEQFRGNNSEIHKTCHAHLHLISNTPAKSEQNW